MANRADINWIAIRNEYLTGNISYQKLAEKHGVSADNVRHKAAKEKWKEHKHTAHIQIAQKTVSKTIEKTSEKQATIFTKELEAAQLITEIVLSTLKDTGQFNKHLVQKKVGAGKGISQEWVEEQEFSVVDAKRLKDVAAALGASESLQRRIKGVLLEAESQKLSIDRDKLKLDEERLAIDKAKAGVGDEDDENPTGVVVLPDINMQLMENAVLEETKDIVTKQFEEAEHESDS